MGLPHVCPHFDRILALVTEMIRRDSEPIARTRMLLEILEVLSEQMPTASGSDTYEGNDALHQILRWTQKHFTEEISLADAAAVVGFTKNYFCTWFRRNTGSTYLRYLNEVRLQNACRLLVHGGSVSSACYESGFRDMSYFIQLFRKVHGCTPKKYIRNFIEQRADCS